MLGVDDRSFARFGGLAAILLALTSWAAVLAYAALVQPGGRPLGPQIFQFLYALVAFWALFAIATFPSTSERMREVWPLVSLTCPVAIAGMR